MCSPLLCTCLYWVWQGYNPLAKESVCPLMRRKMEMAEILYAAFPSFLMGKAYSQTYQVPEALHRILGSEKILPVREENLMEHLFHLVTLVSIRWVGCIQGYLIG